MLNKLLEILNIYIENYAIIPQDDGTSSIVFYYPYLPYCEGNKDSIFIDAYYKASNELYHITNKMIYDLNSNGYIANRNKSHTMKSLAVQGGLGARMRTTLVANSVYGTRIVLGAIDIMGNYELLHTHNDICVSCNSCVRNCPSGALTEEGFNINKCVRQLQNLSAVCEDSLANAMGNKVWGCDECQKHCPINNSDSTPMAEELRELLNVDTFIHSAIKGKKGLSALLPYIGDNYLKSDRLLALAVNAANNTGNYNSIDIIRELTKSNNEAIEFNALRMLRDYNNLYNK